MSDNFDIAIIGGGLVGLTTALAISHVSRQKIAIVDRGTLAADVYEDDQRASAISASSWRMFEALGVAAKSSGLSQPIHDILISDGDVGSAPSPLSLHFSSEALKSEAMGVMIENSVLMRSLIELAQDHPDIHLLSGQSIETLEQGGGEAIAGLSGGKLRARMIIGADGRNSAVRKLSGIEVDTLKYSQMALVTTVQHEKPHDGVAHEIFFPSGPFAILPLTKNRANIVWTDRPAAIKAAMALPDDAFAHELARRFGDFLGHVAPVSPRQAFPLSLQIAESYTSARAALIGDAAHAIHPIAGQGLNMGLRDAAAIADCIQEAVAAGLDPGLAALEDYAVWRGFDNQALAGATDILNRLFSNNFGPLKHLRRLGLGAVDRMGLLRKFFILEAAGLNGELPTLLR